MYLKQLKGGSTFCFMTVNILVLFQLTLADNSTVHTETHKHSNSTVHTDTRAHTHTLSLSQNQEPEHSPQEGSTCLSPLLEGIESVCGKVMAAGGALGCGGGSLPLLRSKP